MNIIGKAKQFVEAHIALIVGVTALLLAAHILLDW